MPASPGRHHDLKLPRLDEAGEDGRPDVSVTTEGENFNVVPPSQGQAGPQGEEQADPARQQHNFRDTTYGIWAGLDVN